MRNEGPGMVETLQNFYLRNSSFVMDEKISAGIVVRLFLLTVLEQIKCAINIEHTDIFISI